MALLAFDRKVIERHFQAITLFLIKPQRLKAHCVDQSLLATRLARSLFGPTHNLSTQPSAAPGLIHPQITDNGYRAS